MTGADPDTLDAWISGAAAARPQQPALVLPAGRGEAVVSFADLERRITAVAAGLQHAGLQPGQRAAVLVPPTADFFALIFGLLRLRAVPVLIDPGIGRTHLRTCLAEAAPHAFLGVRKAHLARTLLRWCPDAELGVLVGPGPVPGRVRRLADVEAGGAADAIWRPPPADLDALAAVVFTSGSTGVPKGVEQTQTTLLAQTRLIAELYGLGRDDVSLATFPPFALFGPPLGMTTVVPRMDPTRPAAADPGIIIDTANRHGATVMFGSPALLDTVARGAGAARFTTLRRVISAGAPVGRRVQRGILALTPAGVQVYSPYGATEALPVSSIGSGELLTLPEPGICVGHPAPGVDVTLMRISDDPIPVLDPSMLVAVGTVGEVVVRGPNVTRSYLHRPESTAAAKTRWEGEPAHRMGDLASFDDEGRLWFAGRKAHRVETPAGLLFSVPVEEIFNAAAGVRRTALVGVSLPGGGLEPVLIVERERGGSRRRGAVAALTEQLLRLGASDPQAAQVRIVLFHRGFPVDIRHNAKIDRPALARWAARRLRRPDPA